MIAAATLAGTAASLAALAYLAATDPKRRRVFRLPPAMLRHPAVAWAAALVPGVAVAWAAGGGGFLVWFGAVTVAGWCIAALRPGRAEAARAALGPPLARLRDDAVALGRRLRDAVGRAGDRRAAQEAISDRIAGLEARVAFLEAELARLRAPAVPAGEATDAVVVELPVPARR